MKQRAKRRRHRPAVPAIVMGKVRSLGSKTDELAALIKTQRNIVIAVCCVSRRHGFTHISWTTAWPLPASALLRWTGT